MKNGVVILFAFLSINYLGLGQGGYLGNLNSVNFSIGTNFWMINYGGKLNPDPGIVLPDLKLGFEHVRKNQRKGTVEFKIGYQMLPNLYETKERKSYNSNFVQVTYDTSTVRCDNFTLGISLKKYFRVAPIGGYFTMGGSLNIIQNKGLLQTRLDQIYSNQNLVNTIETRSVKSYLNVIGEVPFGFGKVVPLKNRLSLDFGGRTKIILKRGRSKNYSGVNLLTQGRITWANVQSIYATSFIQFYVKLRFHY